jgi:hypothetical protein
MKSKPWVRIGSGPDPDLDLLEMLDPDPDSMNPDPQHRLCCKERHAHGVKNLFLCSSPERLPITPNTTPVKKETTNSSLPPAADKLTAAAAAGQLKTAVAVATTATAAAAAPSPKMCPLKAPVSPTAFPKVLMLPNVSKDLGTMEPSFLVLMLAPPFT